MDTDPNGYRDFFTKLVKKIPVSVEKGTVFLVPRDWDLSEKKK